MPSNANTPFICSMYRKRHYNMTMQQGIKFLYKVIFNNLHTRKLSIVIKVSRIELVLWIQVILRK